jgi:DHA1 family multidrug resistance protein-like MFS transporter
MPAGEGTLRGPDPACYTRRDAFDEADEAALLDNMEVLAACAPGGAAHGSGSEPAAMRRRIELSGAVVGVLLVFAATGLLAGVYESSWTLLLVLRHATTFEVGLSWTLFALPFALLSVPAGRLATRYDRRLLALSALACSAGFCALYPFLHSIPLLIACCTFEAVGSVIGTPAAVLVLTRSVPPANQGEAQGSVETARMAATALAAAASGALFGVNPLLPFVITAGVAGCAGVAVAIAWRKVAPGDSNLGPTGASEGVVAHSPAA